MNLDPRHPSFGAPTERAESPLSASDSGSEDETTSWVKQTLAKSQNDNRTQPWKKVFKSDKVPENMENTMEDDKDLVVVPPKLPMAGEATIYEQQSLAG